jgi:phage baseplate assembly protein V
MSRKAPTANDIIRVGRVTAVYEERHTVTVEFRDYGDGIVTKELPVGVPLTRKNHFYALPDEGEHVVCVFYGNGLSEGVVLCAIYDAKNPPPSQDRDRYYIEFEGGAHILVDRKERFIQIRDFEGSWLKMKGGSIYAESSGGFVDLNLHQEPEEKLRSD